MQKIEVNIEKAKLSRVTAQEIHIYRREKRGEDRRLRRIFTRQIIHGMETHQLIGVFHEFLKQQEYFEKRK